MRDCPYCGNPLPIDRTRSCGDIQCRRAIKTGYVSRPRRRPEPALADTLPARERRFLQSLLLHHFNVRTWE
jgi:hypothetical protein